MTDGPESPGADRRQDELDRDGRAAASALLARIEEMVDDGDEIDWSAGSEPGAAPTPPPTDEPVRDASDPHVVPLGSARGRTGGRNRSRRALAGAAAVAALVGIGGAIALTQDGDRPDVTSGGPGGALLPTWLPDGLEPIVAVDDRQADLADGLTSEMAVYGAADATDPWAATLAVTQIVISEGLDHGGLPIEGEAVTVAGHDATLSRIGGLHSGGRGRGWQVRWFIEDGLVGVAGTNMSRDQVLAAAADVTDDPGIGEDGLPTDFVELARGPLDAAVPGFDLGLGIVASSSQPGLRVTYAPPEHDDGQTLLTIIQRPAPASAVDLLRGSSDDTEAITVRGHHGAVSRSDATGLAVQWAEPDGHLVTVIAGGFTERALLRVVEQLRPAEPGQIEALVAEHGPPPPGGFTDVAAGQVEVASGAMPEGGRWRVVADPSAGESMAALVVEVATDGAHAHGSGSASGSASGSGGVPPALELSTNSTEGGTVVYGLVPAEAATVTLESPGGPPVPLDLHTVDGWDRQVAASLIRFDVTEAVAIARAADGREVARTEVYGRPDPITPEGTGSGTTEVFESSGAETCTIAPGGPATCSSGAAAPTDTITLDG